MSERTGEQLLDGTVRVFDVRCSAPTGGPGAEECARVTEVVLPLSGVFEVHRGRRSVVADAGSVVVLRADQERRVSHPATGGDRSLDLVFPPEIVEEALGPETRGGPVGPRVRLGGRALASALRLRATDMLEAEEFALVLLGMIEADLAGTSGYRPVGEHQRARVEWVRALLAAEPNRTWTLDELAREVHCSAFHLARQFRRLTGSSIGRDLVGLRLALALQRLAEDEDDLARLAADLGFASHSHFSARFRSVFGLSPSAARSILTAGRLDELRRFVTAETRIAS